MGLVEEGCAEGTSVGFKDGDQVGENEGFGVGFPGKYVGTTNKTG